MKSTLNTLLIAGIVLAFMFLQGTTPKPGPVDPVDPKTTAAIAQKIPGTIAALQAENYAAVAKQLRAGTLKDETAAAEFLIKRNKAAIDAAYKPLDEHLEKVLGDGRFTIDIAAKTYQSIGEGLQKASGK